MNHSTQLLWFIVSVLTARPLLLIHRSEPRPRGGPNSWICLPVLPVLLPPLSSRYRNLVPSQNCEEADRGECQNWLTVVADIVLLFLSDSQSKYSFKA